LVGLLILVFSAIGFFSGNHSFFFIVSSGLAITTAFLMSFFGLFMFAREAIFSDDRFHMLHTNLSMALLFFAVAEVIGVAVRDLPDIYQIAVGLVQLIGVLLWAEGTAFYLYAANNILEFSDKKLILPLIVILSTLPYIVIQSFLILNSTSVYSHLFVTIPLEIGLTVILISQIIILWHYRKGYFALPLLLSILGTLSILVRTLIWSSVNPSFATSETQLLGILAYWLIGLSLLFVRRGESIVESI